MKNKKLLTNLGIISCLTIGISPAFLLTSCSKKTSTDNENQTKPDTNPSGPVNTIKPTIDFNLAPSYEVGSTNTITAICSNIDSSKSYEVSWKISNSDAVELVDNPGYDVSLKANQAGTFELTANLLENGSTLVATKTKTIIFNEIPTNSIYNATITTNNQSQICVGNNQIFNANITSSDGSEIPNNFYYEWVCEPNETINNNGQSSINITWENSGLHTLSLNVYDSSNKANLVANATFQQNVLDENSIRYGLTVDGTDPITSRKFSNQAVDFDTITNNAQNTFDQNLTQEKVNNYLNQVTNNYINVFTSQRSDFVSNRIIKNNVTLNDDKSITGEISIEFTITNDISASAVAATYKAGDKEVHTFIFENNKIEAYVNKAVTNFLSFKIIPKYIKKQYIKSNTIENKIIGVKDSPLYFDSIDELTLQLNNTLFATNTNSLFENMYLYNSSNTTSEQRQIIKEVIISLLTEKAKLICSTNDNPLRPGLTLTSPILEIPLSKNYNISIAFAKDLMWTLGSLFNFIPTKAGNVKVINDKLYFETTSLLCSSANYLGKFVDLSSGSEQNLTGLYIEISANDIFDIESQIKEKLIENNKSKILGNWLDYVQGLTQRQKAEKIYDFILSYVSYGQNGIKFPSSIGGYLEQRVICEGYANLFSYVANILGISSITVTGNVKVNADTSGAGGGHAWNLIKVDNNWLWCDPTWDDGMLASSSTYKKDNFLINSQDFFTTETHLDVTNWNSGNDLPIPIPQPTVKLAIPTDAELMITGKSLWYSGNLTGWLHPLSRTTAINKINEYGVLNAFSLVTKMYANSDKFFNNSNFDNIVVELLENQNYNKLKFKISGTAKNNLTNWGRFPFSSLIEGWNGATINSGDKVEVFFTYQRWSQSTEDSNNRFDSSRITFGSTTGNNEFKWLGIDTLGKTLKLPYTSDFSGYCEIYVNNKKIHNSRNNDNRVFFGFIYYNENGSSFQAYNNSNIFCDNTGVQ